MDPTAQVAGRSFGEIGLSAAAGHVGAPIVLLSGDDTACTELHELVPKATTVAVKQIPAPIEVDVDFYSPYSVYLATLVPGISRCAAARTVRFTATDFEEAYRLIQLLVQLASIKPT